MISNNLYFSINLLAFINIAADTHDHEAESNYTLRSLIVIYKEIGRLKLSE